MTDQLPPDLTGLDRDDWLSALDEFGEDKGYFQPIGARHSAVFYDDGPVLLVSFETIDEARARPLGLPLGLANAMSRGWSSLTILADGATWYRDKRLYGYFDRLVDDSFFEDFDRVIFIGAGMGAYGACAYSVASPGATVLAFQPRATLDPTRAGWDKRDANHRRLNFTDRYGYAPQMIEAADRVFLFYDPEEQADAIHAAAFLCENCTPIKLRFSGSDPMGMMAAMGGLSSLISLAGSEAGLAPLDLYQIIRKRRLHHNYTRRLLTSLAQKGRLFQLAKAARHLSVRMGRGRYAKDHEWSVRRLAEAGQSLPAPLPREKVETAAVSLARA